MRFVPTPEQRELRSTARTFLHDQSPETEVRRLMETAEGIDKAVWKRLSTELGLCGLHVPEEYGGDGASLVDTGVVVEEMGATLACLPYLSSVVLTQSVLVHSAAANDDDESVASRWLPEMVTGNVRGTVALDEWTRTATGDRAGVRARADGGLWRLDGIARFVLDGSTADLLLVYAPTAAGLALFLVRPGTRGVDRQPVDTLDLTRRQADIHFSAAEAELVVDDRRGRASLDYAMTVAAVGIALEQLGATQRVLDMAVDYAKIRHQFGRPIGSFQAIKHKCADVLVDVEAARSAAYAALWAVAYGDPDARALASLAKAFCSDASLRAAYDNIQVHGGIGFTWEHPAHLYLRRAKSAQLMFGDSTYHRHLFAEQLGLWPGDTGPASDPSRVRATTDGGATG